MADYMLFGVGYNGDKRHFDNDSGYVKAVSKPEYHSVNNGMLSYRSEGFFDFTVERFVHDGATYNIAWHKQKPSDIEIIAAILKFNPAPF